MAEVLFSPLQLNENNFEAEKQKNYRVLHEP